MRRPVFICIDGCEPHFIGLAKSPSAAVACLASFGAWCVGSPNSMSEGMAQRPFATEYFREFLRAHGHDPDDWDITEENFLDSEDHFAFDLSANPFPTPEGSLPCPL